MPLRRRVRFLGRLLGEVLREQVGPDLFDIVERVRRLAIQIRWRDPSRLPELLRLVERLDPPTLSRLVRAFGVTSISATPPSRTIGCGLSASRNRNPPASRTPSLSRPRFVYSGLGVSPPRSCA